MRVAILTTSYPRNDGDPSGHFVRAAARKLAAEGHDVHVIAAGGSYLPSLRPRREGQVVVHGAGGAALFAWPGALARARQLPLRLVAGGVVAASVPLLLASLGRLDRVVAHWIVPCGYPFALFPPFPPRRPLEVVAHGADVRLLLSAPGPVRAHVVSSLVAHGARFAFAAESLLSALMAALPLGLGASLASVARVEAPALDVPIDLQASAQLRASCGLKPGQILAVSVGRLVPKKRVDLAIAAAEHARGRARLVIVGDGPERERLEKRATRMGVSSAQVTFAGLVPRPLALAWIRASDVLVHLSEAEGAPTAVREARSMGVPVVACPAGDIAAWARTDPGIVLCAPSAAAVADAILGPMR